MVVLTSEQVRFFHDQGYVHLPGFVPRGVWERAVRAVNGSLGKEGIDPGQLTKFRSQTYCPELSGHADLVGLVEPALPMLEGLMGAGNLKRPDYVQIALRFPQAVGSENLTMNGPHIDGIYSPSNGVPKGSILNFTALFCVLLSDCTEANCGNFTVWPGSHLAHAEYFRKHGPEALLKGMPAVPLAPAHQILGKAGDAVLAHYLLGHTAAPHVGPHIRYATFFRLEHKKLKEEKFESMTRPFLHLPGADVGGRHAEVAGVGELFK